MEPRRSTRYSDRRPVARHRALTVWDGEDQAVVVVDCRWRATLVRDHVAWPVYCPRCGDAVPTPRED